MPPRKRSHRATRVLVCPAVTSGPVSARRRSGFRLVSMAEPGGAAPAGTLRRAGVAAEAGVWTVDGGQ
jgi:hypothetical protein